MTPHKHAEVIKAWADGAEIEFRGDGVVTWQKTTLPEWNIRYEYRVKPQPVMTIKYRLWIDTSNYVNIFREGNYTSPTIVEKLNCFVRWIDTDWQQHEV